MRDSSPGTRRAAAVVLLAPAVLLGVGLWLQQPAASVKPQDAVFSASHSVEGVLPPTFRDEQSPAKASASSMKDQGNLLNGARVQDEDLRRELVLAHNDLRRDLAEAHADLARKLKPHQNLSPTTHSLADFQPRTLNMDSIVNATTEGVASHPNKVVVTM